MFTQKDSVYKVSYRAKTLVTFLFLAFCSCFVHAESISFFDYIGEEQGLLNGSVEDITQDHDGYIWFGTQAGLFRFDGVTSSAYLKDGRPGSLLDTDIFDLLVTSDNTLWVATNTEGIARFDRSSNSFQHISSDTKPLQLAHFRAVQLLEYNNKIIVRTEQSIEAIDIENQTSTRYTIIMPDGTENYDFESLGVAVFEHGLLAIVNGKVYFAKEGETMFKPYGFTAYRHYAYIPEAEHYAIYSADAGNVYLYTRDGLFYIDQETKHIKKEPLFNASSLETGVVTIQKIAVDSYGTHWIVTRNQGVYYRYADAVSYKKIPIGNGRNQLNTNLLLSFFVDSDRNIWIGTDGYFAAKFRAEQDKFLFYSNYQEADISLHTNALWNMLDWNNETYLTTHKGLFKIVMETDSILLKPVLTNPQYHFAYDADVVDDALYFTTKQGLYRYQSTGVVTDITQDIFSLNPLTESIARKLVQIENSENHLFLGTYSGLIVLDKKTQKTTLYNSTSEGQYRIKDNWTWLLRFDKYNKWLWVGTTSGIEVISAENHTEEINEVNQKLSKIHNAIHDVYVHENGEAWIATSLGLYRFTKEHELLEYKHFSDNDIRAIQVHNNDIWMTTGNGLIHAPDLGASEFQYFVREDGIYNSSNSEGSRFYSKKNNALFFGGDRGLLVVDPGQPITIQKAKVPLLEKVLLINSIPYTDIKEKILAGEKLAFSENSLRFHYAYLDYKAPQRIRFQYMLEGFDQNWSEITSQNSVPYTNLPSGKYKFHLRAFNPNNLLSEDTVLLEFAIKNPWWKSIWAYLLYIFLLLGSMVYLFNYLRTSARRQRQGQLQRKKEEFISSYSEYSVLLSSLSSYQIMSLHFLDRVMLLTGASYVLLKQIIHETPYICESGERNLSQFSESVEQNLIFSEQKALLIMHSVSKDDLPERMGDINLLYQQMVLAQENLIERSKYKWNQYHDARTGLLTPAQLGRIMQEGLARAEIRNQKQLALFWSLDAGEFLQNNLIERIQLMKYGELIKETLGEHALVCYLDKESQIIGIEAAKIPGFFLYVGGSDSESVAEIKRQVLEIDQIYRSQYKNHQIVSTTLVEITAINPLKNISRSLQNRKQIS